ncbi:hypothetical protein NDU88_012204 [Pleurodeles waltl]|uniref:Uncharacterized protein n=1 Tax=Pleurodeles waltl TaxID=8319 RepID=A0AAV7R004_PLEWA|nr:hypothetical protein NDU88_012204 [Pleurodeles waltl]
MSPEVRLASNQEGQMGPRIQAVKLPSAFTCKGLAFVMELAAELDKEVAERAKYVAGLEYKELDVLSCLQWMRFNGLAQGAAKKGLNIPDDLWWIEM